MNEPRALTRADLARPLEDAFESILHGIAQRRKLPSVREPARLAEHVAALSRVYNSRTGDASPGDAAHLGARLSFSFARDVPKAAAAVAELVLSGRLSFRGATEPGAAEAVSEPRGAAAVSGPRPAPRGELRVLDLGAGMGATSRGVARALAAAGEKGTLAIDLVDADETVLAIAEEIGRTRPKEGDVTLATRSVLRDIAAFERRGKPYDLILIGQALSELDRHLAPDARVAAHVALLARLLREGLTPRGSLVVIEPALRDRSRHLHLVRDALVAGGAHVFAPCLHTRPCPALVRETDWCHEDFSVELPAWLVPVARAAGLRYEGLTFSYLVLRRDDAGLGSLLPTKGLVRAVSGPLVSKGKHELLLCPAEAGPVGLVRAMRLDRHESPPNEPWGFAERGDLLRIDPALPSNTADAPRITVATTVVNVALPGRVPEPAA